MVDGTTPSRLRVHEGAWAKLAEKTADSKFPALF
jgi:hypothetical protein